MDVLFIKMIQPPFLAQLELAPLIHPFKLAPSFSSGFKTTFGSSIRSFAKADPYRRAIFDLVVDATGVVISDIAVPACLSVFPSFP
jgi:hypothetical protein